MSDFFVQKVSLISIPKDRFQYFKEVCTGKSVLHIGFVDWPITDVKQNMHLQIDSVCSSLVGVDPNYKDFEPALPMLTNKEIYGSIDDIKGRTFDIVIVPEVIEHVGNVEQFLQEIETVDAKTIYISAPNAFDLYRNGGIHQATGEWIEIVHPDHNCWYSPYTLNNTVKKYTSLVSKSTVRLLHGSVVGIYTKS